MSEQRGGREEDRGRMIARVVTVLVGYFGFNAARTDAPLAAVMLWVGIVLVGWYGIDRFSGSSPEPSRAATIGAAIGAVLLIGGIALALSSMS